MSKVLIGTDAVHQSPQQEQQQQQQQQQVLRDDKGTEPKEPPGTFQQSSSTKLLSNNDTARDQEADDDEDVESSPCHSPSLLEDDKDEQRYYVYGDGTDSAEAYSSISVTAALVFGFAVTTFVTVEAGNTFVSKEEEEDDDDEYTRIGHIAFGVLMAMTITLSAYGFLVMSLQYYQVRRMRVVQPDALHDFLKATFWYRHVARGTTWMALALYLVGLLCYSTIIWKSSTVVAAFLAAIFGTGALAVMWVWCQLNHQYMQASGKKKKNKKRKTP